MFLQASPRFEPGFEPLDALMKACRERGDIDEETLQLWLGRDHAETFLDRRRGDGGVGDGLFRKRALPRDGPGRRRTTVDRANAPDMRGPRADSRRRERVAARLDGGV